MGNLGLQVVLLFGSMTLSYGILSWIGNLRRGEDLTTSLTHGPALIVLLVGFLAFIGGGTWLVGVVARALFGS